MIKAHTGFSWGAVSNIFLGSILFLSLLTVYAGIPQMPDYLTDESLGSYYLRVAGFELNDYSDSASVQKTLEELEEFAAKPDLTGAAVALICHIRRRVGGVEEYTDSLSRLIVELEEKRCIPAEITRIFTGKRLLWPCRNCGDLLGEKEYKQIRSKLLETYSRPGSFRSWLFVPTIRDVPYASGARENYIRKELQKYLGACGLELVSIKQLHSEKASEALEASICQWLGAKVGDEDMEANIRDFYEGFSSVYFQLGYIPERQNRFDEAIPLLQTYIHAFADYSDDTELQRAYISLARCLQQLALTRNDHEIKKRFDSLATEYIKKFGETGIFTKEMNRFQEELREVKPAK